MKKLLFTLFSLAIIGIACLSCKIGLGQAVDTQPPEVVITKPEVGAIIRDAFIIGGTWTDDGSIKSEGGLLVSLERTDDSGEKVDYYGKVGDGDWSCVIDPLNSLIPLRDGEYQATITMTDTYEHETVKTITFSIDNTAPIVVLQRPSAKIGSSSPDSYGQSFTLEGQSADDSNINSIEVFIYEDEDCSVLKHTVTLNNVPPTIELDVAKFIENEENDYAKIYGSTTRSGTRQFYCKMIAYDGAQRYPIDGTEQTEADKKGNATDHYYLYEEISAPILNDYKITEVYHMLNGNYTGGDSSSRAATISSVQETLSENKITTGFFSLNPANNPTFVVSGRNTLAKDGTDFDTEHVTNWEISSGTKVQVEVSTGLDGIPLEGDSLGVYVIECDAKGEPKDGAEKISIISPKTELSDDAAIAERESLIAKSGTSYKFTTALDASKTPALQFNHSYIFGIYGKDQKGNEVTDFGNSYGFYFIPSGSAPVITVTSPSNTVTYLHKGQSQIFAGTAEVEDSVPVISLYNGDTLIASTSLTEADATILESGKRLYSFNFEVPATGANSFNQSTSAQYNYTILATKGGVSSSVAKTIMYDVDPPQVSLITIEPKAACYLGESVTPDGFEYLNGEIKIKVTVTDEFDTVDSSKQNKCEFIQNGEVKITCPIDNFPTKEITNIDTTALNDNSDVELVITAYDRAGNEIKTSQTHKVSIGNTTDNRAHEDSFGTNLIFKVNQETDRPYIIPGTKTTFTKKVEADLDTSTAANPNGYNIFSSGQQLIVKCIDDDGLGEVKVYKEKYDSAGHLVLGPTGEPELEEHTGKGKDYGGTTKEESFSYYLPEKAGIHYLNIKVTDKNGKEKETGTFIFKITAGYPVIEKVSSNRNYSNGAADRKFDNTIKINSDQGPFKVFRSTSNNFDLEHDTPIYTTGETETEWTDEGLNPQTTTKYYYCVQDKNLHESNSASIECKVETAAPETLTITSPVNDSRTGTNSITDTNFTFGGSATDKDSGVKYIYYCFRTTDAAPTQLSDYTKMDASNGSWSVSKTLNQGTSAASAGNLYEGKWYLFVKAEDEAGNISATAVRREFEVDMLMPVTQFTGTVPEKVKEAFTVTGTSSDTHGLAAVILKDEKSSYTKTLTVDGNNAWSQEVTLGTGGLADGEHILVVTGTDLSGKTTTEKKTVFVDTKAPVIDASVTVPKGTDFDYADVEFRGKVTDASPSSGVKYVKFYIANGTDPNASGYQKTPELTADGTNTWSKSITHANYPAIFGTNQGVKYVYIYSEDEAGNKSTEVCKEIVYDTENPVLSELKYTVNSVSKAVSNGESVIIGKNSFELSGKFNDTVSNVTVEVARGSQSQNVTQNPETGKSGTWTVSQTSISDGVYKYQVQAKDASGRTSDSSEISIRVDTTAPEVKTIQTPSEYDTQNTSISFNGTASDGNGSGIEVVYLGFAEKTNNADLEDASKFVVVNGTDNWYYTVDTSTKFTSVWSTSGNKTVYVYTKDKAGNISDVKTAGFKYDTRSPTLDTLKYKGTTGSAITLQADNAGKYSFFLGELFTLDVTASDDWGVDSITYTEKKDNGTPSAAKALTSTTKLPEQGTANSKPATGTYEYQITIKDKAGKSITKQLTVQVDVTAPTITITSPSSTASGDASLKGTDYSFQGDVSDTGYSGLKAYYYAITTSATAPTEAVTDTTKWTEVAQTSNGLWTRKLNLKNGTGTNNATDLYEGHYYLHVKAIDNAGNLTAVATTREFYVDQAAPVISEVGYKDGTDAKITIAEGRTYYKSTNGSVTFSGKVTDTYGVESLKLNGNDVTVSTTDGSWSKSVTMTADTDITLALVATDKAGRKTEQTYILHRDTKDPSVEITNPDSDIRGVNSLSASTYTFRGPVSDSGSGILTYKYVLTSTPIAGAGASDIEAANATAKKIADGETPTQAELDAAEAVKQAIITSAKAATNTAGWVTGTAKDGFSETRTLKDGKGTNTSSNIYEGQQYIYLYAEDKVGNETGIGRSYWVDKKNPDLDENGVGAAGKQLKKNGSQTLKGTVSDANGIKSLQIIDDLSENVWDVTNIDGSGNWSITIAAGSGSDKLCDGEHSLTVKAVDNADKATEKTRSVSVDTIAPDSTGIYFNATPDWEDEANSISWFKNANVPIKVTGVKDDKSTATAKAKAYASGVAAVEYSTDSGANWVSMSEDVNNTWIATAYCNTQGQNTIYARVKDAFGNYSDNMTIAVYIDTEAPVSPTTNEYWVELKTLTAAEKTAETNGTKPKASATATKGLTGSLLTNNADAKRVMVELIVKDANSTGTLTSSGVKEVSLSYGTNGANKITAEKTTFTPAVAQGQTSVEYDVYNLVLPPAAVKDGDCVISLTDNVGNTKEFKPFSFETDTTAPKIKINTINDADKETTATGTQVNKKFNLAGTGSDNRQVKQLDVCYYYNNTWTNIYSTTNADSIFNWTKEIDTVKSATCTFGNTTDMDGKEVTFCVIITDEAGNRNLDTGSGSTLVDNTKVENGKLIPKQAPTSIAADNKATVKIDQDSDRPIVKINNFSLSGMTSSDSVYLTGQPTIWGMVSDDDGLDTVKYRTRAITTPAASWGAWTTLTVSDGQFSIPDLPNGNQEFQFQVKDSAGNTFETGASTSLAKIKLQDKDGTKFGTSSATDASLYVRVDTENPTFGEISLNSYTGTSATTATSTGDSLGASTVVGGVTKKAIEIVTNAQDTNGIKGITIEFVDSAATPKKVYYRSNSNVSVSGASTYAATGSVTKTEDSTVYTYTTPKIDLSTFAEGLVKVTITAWDNAGQSTPNQTAITIDNTAPTFEITTPAADIEDDEHAVFGIQSNTVGGNTGSALDVETISYKITTSATTPTDGWNVISGAFTTASLVFDGAAGHLPNLHDQIATVVSQAAADADDNVTLYVHFKATDNCGNSGYAKRKLIVIPNGDKPSVKFTYPETNGKALAGTIRIYGTVEQPIGLTDKVFVQIDPNYNGTFNASGWKDAFDTCCSGKNTEYKFEDFGPTGARQTGIVANGTQNWNLVLNANKELNATSGSRSVALRVYAISSGGKLSEPFVRTFTVDPNAPHIGGDGTGEIPLEVVQFESGKVGDFTKITARQSYSNEMWLKGDWYLIASVTDNSGIKELTLDEGISAGTKSLIKNCAVNSSDLTLANGTAAEDKTCKITQNTNVSSDTAGKNWNMCIPLCTGTGSGTLKYTFTATENTDNNNICTETITIYYDNKAPQIGTKDHAKYNISPDIKQSDGFYTLSGYATDADTTAGAKVSGMQGIAFYFMRRGTVGTTKTTRVYDPMWENKSVTVRTGAPTDASGTNATDIVYNNGLYWKKKTVTRNANNLPVLTLSATDDNIHAGGYAQLAGSIYRIKSVSGTTVTLDGKPPVQSTTETAYFALALVVDNFDKAETATGRTIISSGYGKGYYSASSTGDDGDLMQESWDGDSNEGKWTAMINSANIPDGPIELHYVVFDQAWNYSVGIVGNVNETTYATYKTLDVTENENTTNGLKKLNTDDSTNKLASRYHYAFTDAAYISNNAPRIVGVTVGTDYNGDGTIKAADGETDSKYVNEASRIFGGVATKKATGSIKNLAKKFIASADGTSTGAAWFTVKDKANVQIEIVGGNGDLFIQYAVDKTYKEHQTTANYYTKYNSGNAVTFTRGTETEATDDDFNQGYIKATKLPAIEFDLATIRTAAGANSTLASPTWYTFEIWDSTEETTKFTDSQCAELKLPIAIEVFDKTAPNTYVNPLFWKSATDNSVYVDANDELHGHVELAADTTGTSLGTTYGTTDDKVSGTVVFRGTAWDNKRLAKLEWAIVSSDGKTSLLPYTAANTLTYTTGATFNGSWTGYGTLGDASPTEATKHYKFKVYDTVDATQGRTEDDIYLNSKGHKVMWELIVDTSYINGVVASNAKVYVRATDTSTDNTGNKPYMTDMTGTGSTDATKKTADKSNLPTYQVDILPYITGVSTRLSKNKGKDYARTALGHYPIVTNEGNITLQGYNLAANSADVTVASTSIKYTDGSYSGPYEYTVSGTIKTINNMNNNNAHGSYDDTVTGLSELKKNQNRYNRQPNASLNATLTDDIYFDVWTINDSAATSNDGTGIADFNMKVNPSNGMVGFAFASGADSFCMPDGTSNTYQIWSTNYANFNNVTFDYDSSGATYCIAVGCDTNAGDTVYGGRMAFMTSKWGRSSCWNNTNDNFAPSRKLRIDSIGIPSGVYVNGTSAGSSKVNPNRFASASFVKSANGMYLAYCDTMTGQIRFRASTAAIGDSKDNSGQFVDAYGYTNGTTAVNVRTNAAGTGNDATNGGENNWDSHRVFDAAVENYSLIAGKESISGANTGYTGGKYVAIDVVSGNSATNENVVVVFTSGTKLYYTYRKGDKGQDANINNTTYWNTPVELFDGSIIDPTIKVGPDNSIHIAWCDNGNGCLRYAYLSAYNSGTIKQAKIDGYLITGYKPSIDVVKEGSNYVPYISYYLPSSLTTRYAKLADVSKLTSGSLDGCDENDMFTGVWEVSTIPTNNNIENENVEIAFYKKSTGEADKIKSNNTASATGGSGTYNANGTSNPLIAYIRNDTYGQGFVETAQMR